MGLGLRGFGSEEGFLVGLVEGIVKELEVGGTTKREREWASAGEAKGRERGGGTKRKAPFCSGPWAMT